VRLFVRDQGPGMSDAEAAALFTKFTRLPQAHANNIRGSGLGLAVCRLLATRMGGAVGVDSRLGEGSTFWADLPLPAAANAPATPVLDAPSATPLRALIVEDIDYNATAMQAVLRKLGIVSEVASDGITAFEKLQATFYDVAFMDWNLPGMIGTEVVARYRAVEPPNRRTIIVATTAYSGDVNREACLQAGMDAFIAKPFTPEKIGAALADLRGSLRAAASVSVRSPGTAAPVPTAEFDLQMLRFLADETPDGLRTQIDRYVASFDADREAAHGIVAAGDAKEIHRIAHRLVGHASAIKYEPLVRLARELQAHAATDDPARLRRLLGEFDAEFRALRKKLDSTRVSTAPA
ncbi:MAG TPA: response regulator, partial [Opitutus sp.]|nr:response regulator [Opitutus sp.]